jgi:hypothetical protein
LKEKASNTRSWLPPKRDCTVVLSDKPTSSTAANDPSTEWLLRVITLREEHESGRSWEETGDSRKMGGGQRTR